MKSHPRRSDEELLDIIISVVPVAFRIKPGVKSILSSQVSFIIIYVACGSRHVRIQNERIQKM